MRSEPDYYTILQVNRYAEPEVIEAAYRRLAAKYHPDVNRAPEAAEKMKRINAAYDVLSSPEKRRQYDLRLGVEGRGRLWSQPSSSGRAARRGGAMSGHLWWFLLSVIIMAVLTRFNLRVLLPLVGLLLVIWLIQAWQEGRR